LLLVAGESLRRTEACGLARQAQSKAARNEQHAMLGPLHIDMNHSVNNALTSMIGNAELCCSSPASSPNNLGADQNHSQHALRINEIIGSVFSSLTQRCGR